MKLMINYDFFEKVRDAREPLGPLKIVRNNKNHWAKIFLPVYILGGLYDFPLSSIPIMFALSVGTGITIQLFTFKSLDIDVFAELATNDLEKLVLQLKDLYVNTSYDLLLESELYTRKYNVKVNKNKIPYLLEHKYIMVPTYDYNGEIGETSILQEHVVGSKEYVLSIGSPQKQVQFAYSGA